MIERIILEAYSHGARERGRISFRKRNLIDRWTNFDLSCLCVLIRLLLRSGSAITASSISLSEMGSHYLMESGCYMTSFAVTIFIAALVTVGILFIAMLITLTVMLQSCQSKSAGLIQLQETSDLEYEYCRIFALHAELNRLEADELPAACRARDIQYVREVQYLRDFNLTMWVAKSYFSNLRPKDDGLDVVLIDMDDIFTSIYPHHTSMSQNRFNPYNGNNWVEGTKTKHPAGTLILELYLKLQACGWSQIFLTRKPEKQRNSTIESLISAGFGGWSSLIMRSDEEMRMESWEYLSRRRTELQNQGFRIASVISSQIDALTGPCLGKHNFKLPSSVYGKLDHHVESLQQLE